MTPPVVPLHIVGEQETERDTATTELTTTTRGAQNPLPRAGNRKTSSWDP